MKTLVIFGLFVVYTQATSEPISLSERVRQAQIQCIQENNWDDNEMKEIFKNNFLPVDNERVNDFIVCYWKKLGLLNQNNETNIPQLKATIPNLIRETYPNITKDEVLKLADQSVDKCKEKEVDKSKSVGQRCVLIRNCIVQYVKDKQD